MDIITVSVRLYGELSCYGNVIHPAGNYSKISLQLPAGSTLKDLMDHLLMPARERGFTFINEKMSASPNTQSDLDHQLQHGDKILFFPLNVVPNELDFDMKVSDRMKRTVRADENLNLYYLYE